MSDSIDGLTRILSLQEQKRALSDLATGPAAAGLTRDILLQLLE